jgi:hypothetical protein
VSWRSAGGDERDEGEPDRQCRHQDRGESLPRRWRNLATPPIDHSGRSAAAMTPARGACRLPPDAILTRAVPIVKADETQRQSRFGKPPCPPDL